MRNARRVFIALTLTLFFTAPSTLTAQWYNSTWHYRVPVTVNTNGYIRFDKPIEVDLNFTSLLPGGATFNENSLRVVEVTAGGAILDTNVVFQFNRSAGYNPSGNASGTLIFIMSGTTGSSMTRYYHIYFDHGTGFIPKTFSNQLLITTAFWEGQNSYRVTSPLATYYYHIQGAGFASMLDANGNDWIGYHPTGGSAGSYRGIPNMGEWAHPGYTNGTSSIIYQGPIHVRVYSQTLSGGYKAYWDFFPGYVRMTLTDRSDNYWLLYEGTPNGQFDNSDYWKPATGGRYTLSETYEGQFQWAYFGDVNTRRALFLAHHEVDALPDGHRPMEGNMTVFGFGRQPTPSNTIRWMNAVPQRMTFGFAEDSLQAPAIIEGAYRDLQIAIEPVQTNGFSITAIQVIPGVTSAVVSWTTNQPSSSEVRFGTTTAYGTTVTDSTLVQQHTVTITGLLPSTTYNFMVASQDAGGVTVNSANSMFTTRSSFVPSGIQTDQFQGASLNVSLWSILNPLGDASIQMTGTQLALTIPAGTTHDLWSNNTNAPRVTQACANADFDIEAKFDSPLAAQYLVQGILVQQDGTNFIRFDVISTGTSLRVFAATLQAGTPTVRIDQSTPFINTAPILLRVLRSGNLFTMLYCVDGTNWFTAGSFTHTVTVGSVGIFAGNAGNNPGFTCYVDYFKNKALVAVQPRIILQGAYDAASDAMRTSLTGQLPPHHPYRAAPWYYTGLDSLTSIPPGTVDWVLVELRFATDSSSLIGRKAALLKTDGTIVETDGISPIRFYDVIAGNYYIVVRHRSHLGVMSAVAVGLTEAGQTYDFTSTASAAYGTDAQAELSNGKFALYAGDCNASGIVTASDANVVFGALNRSDYSNADANLSGIVTAADANVIFANLNKSTRIP